MLLSFLQGGTDEMFPPLVVIKNNACQFLRVVIAQEAPGKCKVVGGGMILFNGDDVTFAKRVVEDCIELRVTEETFLGG